MHFGLVIPPQLPACHPSFPSFSPDVSTDCTWLFSINLTTHVCMPAWSTLDTVTSIATTLLRWSWEFFFMKFIPEQESTSTFHKCNLQGGILFFTFTHKNMNEVLLSDHMIMYLKSHIIETKLVKAIFPLAQFSHLPCNKCDFKRYLSPVPVWRWSGNFDSTPWKDTGHEDGQWTGMSAT